MGVYVKTSIVPLAMVASGNKARIVSIVGGRGIFKFCLDGRRSFFLFDG